MNSVISKVTSYLPYVFGKPNEKCLIHLHLAKSGGTTLNTMLAKNYNAWRTEFLNVNGRRDANGLPISFDGREIIDAKTFGKNIHKTDNLDCISGHFPYGIHNLIDKECEYITIIRHPVPLLWSKFNHILNRPNHYLYPLFEKYEFKLAKILRSGEVFELFDEQSRMLIGTQKVQLNDEDLEQVVIRVNENIEHIGVTEFYSDFISDLASKLNWTITSIQSKNLGQYNRIDSKADDESINAILECNQVDIKLYEHICKTKGLR